MNKWLVQTLMACLALFSIQAFSFQDIDYSVYFPSVAQGHGSCSDVEHPQFKQFKQAKINGTNNSVVDFCTINDASERNQARCDDGLCLVSGQTVPSLSLTGSNAFKISSETSPQITYCTEGQSLQVTQANHGRIELYSACTVTFSQQSEYKVPSVEVGGGAKLVLSEGDYWFKSLVLNGKREIAGEIVIEIASEIEVKGNVRLFIHDNAVWTRTKINVSGSGTLTVIAYGNLQLNESVNLHAYLYVAEELTLNKTAQIHGRTTSRRLFMEGDTQINQAEQQTSSIDHFRFTLPKQGLTWNALDVTIQACANQTCSERYTDPVTAILNPNSSSFVAGGWVGGSQVTFTNGIATTQLRRNTAGDVTVNVLSSTPSSQPSSVNLCSYTDNPNDYLAANCTVNFVDSGFVIDIPHAYANQSVTGTIKVQSQDEASKQSVSNLPNVSKTVWLWSEYLDPVPSDAGFFAAKLLVNGFEIGQAADSATPISLSFDANGQATFTVRYPETGNLALNAKFIGSGDEQGLRLEGQDTFIRVPRALVLSASHSNGTDQSNGQCLAKDMTCKTFARADEAFTLQIQSVAFESDPENDVTDNNPVNNYQQPNILLQHTLIAPHTGVAGTLGNLSYDHPIGGAATLSQKVSEVGVFDFSLQAPSSYLGLDLQAAKLPIAVVSTGPIGRFIPAYFAVSPMTITLNAACPKDNAFTYLGQPFSYANSPGLYLQPRSMDDSETQNYLIEPWWRYNQQWLGRAYSDTTNGMSLDFDKEKSSPVVRQSSHNSGVVLTGESLWYEKTLQPKAVFKAAFDLTLDANELTDLDGVCYRENASSPCLGYTFAKIDQSMPLYWGKLVIQDVYGAETQPLEQSIYVEHYTSNGFVRTLEDSCTSLPEITGFTFQSSDYEVLNTGKPTQPQVGASLTSQVLSQGKSVIRFSAPGAAARGVIDSRLDLNVHNLMWLAEDQNRDGVWDQTTEGRAQFGLYRGSDRVIWWRESN